jgi:hypothetical protein
MSYTARGIARPKRPEMSIAGEDPLNLPENEKPDGNLTKT